MWGCRRSDTPTAYPSCSLLRDGPVVDVLEASGRRRRERADRAEHLVRPHRGQRRELVQRQPRGVRALELADLVDQVLALGRVGNLVGLVHQVSCLLVAPTDVVLTGEAVLRRRDVLASEDARDA